MMLTEKEARSKWCPFIHTRITIVLPAGDRHSEQRAEHLGRDDRCMSSMCMAWRSAGTVRVDSAGKRVFGELQEFKERIEIGFCGLAGNPEAQS